MKKKILNILIIKVLFLLTFVTGCSTVNLKCNEIRDTIKKDECYEDKETMRYHNHTGWRYERDYHFK